MYFIPLSQPESVELLIHSLRAAGGEVGCRQCPVYRVCTKQCLTVAAAVERMLKEGSLPLFGAELPAAGTAPPEEPPPEEPPPAGSPSGGRGRLKIVK
jgi:hypothetical protein